MSRAVLSLSALLLCVCAVAVLVAATSGSASPSAAELHASAHYVDAELVDQLHVAMIQSAEQSVPYRRGLIVPAPSTVDQVETDEEENSEPAAEEEEEEQPAEEAEAEAETEEAAAEPEAEAEAEVEAESGAEEQTEEAAAEGADAAQPAEAAQGQADAQSAEAAEGSAAVDAVAEPVTRQAYPVPVLPPLAIALDQETAPAVHPAACVAEGEAGPTAEQLAALPSPLNPPEGCGHMVVAWRNYVYCHRTRPDSESVVVGKDQYSQEQTEIRFANFCNNLKSHQLVIAGKHMLTTKQANGTIAPVNEEKIQWANAYLDEADLAHLRGFRYASTFAGGVTHEQFLAQPRPAAPAAPARESARDPLVPDFDFSLKSTVLAAPLSAGNCGADYALAATHLLESTFAVQCGADPFEKTLQELHGDNLSPQQLLACSGTQGCAGGDVATVLNYALANPLRTRGAYPMVGASFGMQRGQVQTPACVVDPAVGASAAKPFISSFGSPVHTCAQRSKDQSAGDPCLSQDEEELARFVAKQPVTAVIAANDQVFGPLYSGYVVSAGDCDSTLGAGNHAVLLAGLLTDARTGRRVWKVQFAYGDNWGHGGYAYLEYGFNTCGLANTNLFVQTTCERPVGPNPPPRPTTPKPVPQLVSKPEQPPPPPKPQVIPTVPVNPSAAGAAAPPLSPAALKEAVSTGFTDGYAAALADADKSASPSVAPVAPVAAAAAASPAAPAAAAAVVPTVPVAAPATVPAAVPSAGPATGAAAALPTATQDALKQAISTGYTEGYASALADIDAKKAAAAAAAAPALATTPVPSPAAAAATMQVVKETAAASYQAGYTAALVDADQPKDDAAVAAA